jgi:hypothetical protein
MLAVENALHEEESHGALRFDHAAAPGLVIVNSSGSLVHVIKWSAGIWNMDLSDRDGPLPIPSNTMEFLRSGQETGPISIFGEPSVRAHGDYDAAFGAGHLSRSARFAVIARM